jgi:hypothetical protein
MSRQTGACAVILDAHDDDKKRSMAAVEVVAVATGGGSAGHSRDLQVERWLRQVLLLIRDGSQTQMACPSLKWRSFR